ncbi:DUF2187 family protein [Bacillus sp. SA1-12]|uniref:DUF2187 family protein n=1 Tax=Bacillus sp. SA1-12 TaxID=1455638 RepID=UPI0006988BD2|nr:DUF2187 family protein [Bacillus sp. SA1-12]
MKENNVAKEGEMVRFKRNGLVILGEVVKVRDESVIVQISKSDAEEINVETPLTVVSHKNYQIIKD